MDLAHDTPSHHLGEVLAPVQFPVQVVVIIVFFNIQSSYIIKAPGSYQVSRQHDCYQHSYSFCQETSNPLLLSLLSM